MAKRRCKYGKKVDGRCRKTPRGGLSGANKTCVRYGVGRSVKSGNRPYMRCAKFKGTAGCPRFRGQRKGFAECTTRIRAR